MLSSPLVLLTLLAPAGGFAPAIHRVPVSTPFAAKPVAMTATLPMPHQHEQMRAKLVSQRQSFRSITDQLGEAFFRMAPVVDLRILFAATVRLAATSLLNILTLGGRVESAAPKRSLGAAMSPLLKPKTSSSRAPMSREQSASAATWLAQYQRTRELSTGHYTAPPQPDAPKTKQPAPVQRESRSREPILLAGDARGAFHPVATPRPPAVEAPRVEAPPRAAATTGVRLKVCETGLAGAARQRRQQNERDDFMARMQGRGTRPRASLHMSAAAQPDEEKQERPSRGALGRLFSAKVTQSEASPRVKAIMRATAAIERARAGTARMADDN